MNPAAPAPQQTLPTSQSISGPTVNMDEPKTSKQPVIRGARACTVCRAAKMKCVGAEDGEPCQRCRRSGAECVFEKHRRGRKPGSKLSEASKMLRRLEKGLNNARIKSQSHEATLSQLTHDPRLFPHSEMAPLNLNPRYESGSHSRATAETSDREEEDDDSDKSTNGMFPAQLIKKENQLQRNSFFKTILNPDNTEPQQSKASGGSTSSEHSPSFTASRTDTRSPSAPPHATSCDSSGSNDVDGGGLKDPIDAGLITESEANVLFEAFFLRLNPFINLFDPVLHTITYVRSRCPFLFTTIIMACCKFFRPDLYLAVKKIAHAFSVHAFAEGLKSVEVVQAFACMTYWQEPDNTRTWTYIGYACRMAVELGLDRFVSEKRLATESDLQWLERRNKERTYLVLFVHDRSLSTQTGRQWMLNDGGIVRHSERWHEQGGGVAPLDRRPEDVILAGFVQLRLIGSETSAELYSRDSTDDGKEAKEDVDHATLLRQCNFRLNEWMDHWESEQTKAGGERFHTAFMRFFWLYLRLFLNSFGVKRALCCPNRVRPDAEAVEICFRSAMEHLQILVDDFANMMTLRYGQETITVMSAYCSVFLLKLLRNPNIAPSLQPSASAEVHRAIFRTAEAYDRAADTSNASTSAAHHARFLKGLIKRDIFESKEQERLREKRDNAAGSSHVHGGFAQSDTRGSNLAPGLSFPDPHGVPADQYGQYQQQCLMSQTASISPQVPQTTPAYVYPSPISASPSDTASVMSSGYQSSNHVAGPMPSNGHNGGLHNAFGYASPQEPSAVVPSQTHPPNAQFAQSQSDRDYSRMMFRNIGDIGFGFYSVNQTQYPQSVQEWMNPGLNPGADVGYSYSHPDYGYQQQQRVYDGYQR